MATQAGGKQSSFFVITQWIALAVVMVALIVFIFQQNRIWKAVDKINSELTTVQKDIRSVKKNKSGTKGDAGKHGKQQAKTDEAASPDSSTAESADTDAEVAQSDAGEETVVHMDVPKPALKHAKHGLKHHPAASRHPKHKAMLVRGKRQNGKIGGGGARTHHLYVPVQQFTNAAAATHERDRLLRLGLPATLRHDGAATSVLLGPFSSKQQADQYKGYAQRALY
jgi:Sec-independent protein translocase protein TatA